MYYVVGIIASSLGVVALLAIITRNLIRLGRRQRSNESLWMLDHLDDPDRIDPKL